MGTLNTVSAFAASVIRLGAGVRSRLSKQPEPALKPMIVYEFEACPFCRKVREALSELDLSAEIRPCPKGGQHFRDELKSRAGKEQFPYLIDPNSGWEGYESADIINYLFKHYGQGLKPGLLLSDSGLATFNAALASLPRPKAGRFYEASTAPEQLLTLYSFEASPYCRMVREKLCELALPYLLINVAKGSPKRRAFVAISGKMVVPYLIDPNQDIAMFESADIVNYLDKTYKKKHE